LQRNPAKNGDQVDRSNSFFIDETPRCKQTGYLFCRVGTVDEGDLPAVRLEGIVPQPFLPYKLHAASSGVLNPSYAIKNFIPVQENDGTYVATQRDTKY